MANEENSVIICEVANEGSKRKHVLVVDDSPIVLKLIRAYLQDDYKVSVVNSGKVAVDFLAKYKPDVIHIHELHAYFVNIKPLLTYIKKRMRPCYS